MSRTRNVGCSPDLLVLQVRVTRIGCHLEEMSARGRHVELDCFMLPSRLAGDFSLCPTDWLCQMAPRKGSSL